MGIVQKDALRTAVISYLGLVLGYVNKVLLFIWFLSTEEIGLLNLLLAVGTLFGSLAGLGSSYAIWKFFPFLRNPEKKHYGFLTLIMLISLVGGVLFSVLAIVFHDEIVSNYQERSQLFVDSYYWIIPLGIANLLYVVFDGFLKSMYLNVISVLVYELVLRGLITVLLIVYGMNLFSFDILVMLHCLLYFVPVIVLAVYMQRRNELHLSLRSLAIPRRFRRIILRYSLYSYLNSVGNLVVITIDAMMVAEMIGLSATGVYTTVIYLTSALQVPYKSMLRVTSPLVSDHWKDRNMEEMNKLYKKFSSVNLVISLGLFLFVWVCREEIFSFLKPEFHEGIWVFLFLMGGRVIDMYSGLNGIIFVTSAKYRYDILFTAFLLIVVWVLNLWLIPIYGITGSAIATCAAFFGYNLGRLLFVWFAYRLHPFEKSQFVVMALFAVTICFFEYIPLHFGSVYLDACLKWMMMGTLFLLPIYLFKIEPEIHNYVTKGLGFVKKKLAG